MLSLVSSPEKRLALLALNFAFFLYHLAAMLDAYGVAQGERARSFGHRPRDGRTDHPGGPGLADPHSARPPRGIRVQGPRNHDRAPRQQPRRLNPKLRSDNSRSTDADARSPHHAQIPPTTARAASGHWPSGRRRRTPQPTRAPLQPIDCATLPAWGQDCKLTVLVAGTDSRSDTGVDDNSIRTDTMLLLTMDIQSGKTALFSFPRDMFAEGHRRQLR